MLDLNDVRAEFAAHLSADPTRWRMDSALAHVVTKAYQKGISDSPMIESLCRSLAFHVIETEGAMHFMGGFSPDLAVEVAKARQLIADAGHDIDVLYPLAERPVLEPAD